MAIAEQIGSIQDIQRHVEVVKSNNENWLYKKAKTYFHCVKTIYQSICHL